ncbi:peptidoglycan/LPS O-acetylase OafA/YrhL [Mesorhizobium soli]|uniref:acyltransferase family protein n=1 Tax=Pseudaminobacter soli (ex Li et al. 2025) TaxID=1295366 RepID=UPI002473C11C|nr:acyltransferase family protein [Mesorhizobium soli]MDH6229598.1 peptidoglycan/LPS O-acetylase OafA/YrhL [Mesorhizobium soli]
MNQRVTVAGASAVSVQSSNIPFIDGLRAISILAVVLYHVGVPGFAGGFVGVDVFFVISGYLIINQIVQESRAGTFNVWRFYSRRAIRILPAFVLVLAASAAIANFVLVTPQEFKEFGNQLLWSSMMLVNHYFFERQGYFETVSDLKPLLNMWSLAVEEQFYLAAPFIIAFCLPRGIRRATLLLAGLSFAACLMASMSSRPYAFFIAPFRAWEFIAGGSAAYFASRLTRAKPLAVEVLGLVGALAIVGAVVGFDSSLNFPSWRALVPVFGAVALLAVGLARPGTATVRLLAVRPLAWIGLVSYSWYLWHWPLLSFGRIWRYGSRDLIGDSAVAILGLLLAVLTYFMVERPMKLNRAKIIAALGDKRIFAAGVLACSLMTLAAASALFISKPNAERNYAQLNLNPVNTDEIYPSNPCALLDSGSASTECTKLLSGAPYGILLGDSHAETAYPALYSVAEGSGLRLGLVVEHSCPPLWGAGIHTRFNPDMDCSDRQRMAVSDLVQRAGHAPDFVVLKSYWIKAFNAGLDEPDVKFRESLENTISQLKALGTNKIIIVGPTPSFADPVPLCALRRGQGCGVSADKFGIQRAEIMNAFDNVLAAHPDIRFIDPAEVLCRPDCEPRIDGVTLYIDTNHLSADGEMILIDKLRDAIL